MSADLLRYAPEGAGIPAESPFPTGRLKIKGKDSGWDIHNDGVIIRFIEDPTGSNVYDPLSLQRPIKDLLERFPIFENIFTFDHRSSEYRKPRTFTLPTVPTLNAFSQDVFYGLPTAGIQLVQSRPEKEEPDGKTPMALYIDTLMERRLAASSNPELYNHDILFHALGAQTIGDSEFDPFLALGKEQDHIGEIYGDAVKASYIARLGRTFDLYTSLGPPSDGDTEDLADFCLESLRVDLSSSPEDSISVRLPADVLTRSQQIVSKYNNSYKARLEYYDEINRRLRQQAPWMPPQYRLPLLSSR